jgi:hypothetical protein
MTCKPDDEALIDRAVACALKALAERKQTPKIAAKIRRAISRALREGTRGELDLAQIGILAID